LSSSRKESERKDSMNSYSLLIGIDDYSNWCNRSYDNLKTCVDSALRINDELFRFGFEDSTLLIAPGNGKASNINPKNLPSKENINYHIKLLKRKTESDDRVLIYFSGHGVIVDNNQHYLIPYSGNRIHTCQDLLLKINEIKARNIFVILDACFSGAGYVKCETSEEGNSDLTMFGNEVFKVLTSSGFGPAHDFSVSPTLENDELHPINLSPFGHSITNKLYEAQKNPDVPYSAADLCHLVRKDINDTYKNENIKLERPHAYPLFYKSGEFMLQTGIYHKIPPDDKVFIEKAFQSRVNLGFNECEDTFHTLKLIASKTENEVWYECFNYLLKFQEKWKKFKDSINNRISFIFLSHLEKSPLSYIKWLHRFFSNNKAFIVYWKKLDELLANGKFDIDELVIIRKNLQEKIDAYKKMNNIDPLLVDCMQNSLNINSKRIIGFQEDMNEIIIGEWTGTWEQQMKDARVGTTFRLFIEEIEESNIRGSIKEHAYSELVRRMDLSDGLFHRDIVSEIDGHVDLNHNTITFTQKTREHLPVKDLNFNTKFRGEIDFSMKKITGDFEVEVAKGYNKKDYQIDESREEEYLSDYGKGKFQVNKM